MATNIYENDNNTAEFYSESDEEDVVIIGTLVKNDIQQNYIKSSSTKSKKQQSTD